MPQGFQKAFSLTLVPLSCTLILSAVLGLSQRSMSNILLYNLSAKAGRRKAELLSGLESRVQRRMPALLGIKAFLSTGLNSVLLRATLHGLQKFSHPSIAISFMELPGISSSRASSSTSSSLEAPCKYIP